MRPRSESQYLPDTLLIFIGHADDAEKEASAVYALKAELSDELERTVKLRGPEGTRFRVLEMFKWREDARLVPGNQETLIATELDRADIALFVFKERVGRITWNELSRVLDRPESEKCPVVLLFPAKPPAQERLMERDAVRAWGDLLDKKEVLTARWPQDDASCAAPRHDYGDLDDLKRLATESCKQAIHECMRSDIRKRAKVADSPRSEPVSVHAEADFLDVSTEVVVYDSNVVQRYRSLLRPEHRARWPSSLTDAQFLSSLHVLRNGRLTRAGVLLFTESPDALFPSAWTRCTQYAGTEVTSLHDRMDVSGPVQDQIEQARAFVASRMDKAERIVADSAAARTTYTYPMEAVREVIANALCHRAYDDSYRKVSVRLFSDRLEVSNPGTWATGGKQPTPEGTLLDELVASSSAQNMRLARAMSSINLAELDATGIPRILAYCDRMGAPTPVVARRDEHITVTLYPSRRSPPTLADVPTEVATPGIAKLGHFVLSLGKRKLLGRHDMVDFLRRHGYAKLRDDFPTLYAHAVAIRRLDGVPDPMLKLFRKRELIAAFHRGWREQDEEPFDESARKAVEDFREGDEVRRLGVDVETEVRALWGTFRELVQQARPPSQQEQMALLREIRDKLAEREPPPVQVALKPAERYARDLVDWLKACRHTIERGPEWRDEESFDLVVEYTHPRRPERYLVRGLLGEVQAGHVAEMPPADAALRLVESWIVGSVGASPAARQNAEQLGMGRLVRTFDELTDEVVDFARYERFVRQTIAQVELDQHYVPLEGWRPEADRLGRVHGQSPVDRLEDFVRTWLEQPVRQHLSVLGEFGTGKTWLCLRLAGRLLDDWHAAKLAGRPRGRYPLLIQLRDFTRAPPRESLLADFLFMRFAAGLPSMEAFRVLNRMGRFLLLFDGFDELVRRVRYQTVVDNFWELAHVVVPGSKAVLTCRTEHFRYEREARQVLRGEETASTEKIALVPPRFEVVLLKPFSDKQVREAIVRRLGDHVGPRTAELVLSNQVLGDLARRPVMIEMILGSLDDLKGKDGLVTSQVYLYATDRQIRKNITEERTFTSARDKVRFLCELAHEMHTTGQLKLHYQQFPDRIREIFGEQVADEEKDHWWYDLMGQTLLVRDEDGHYSFAHRGLVEFFATYHLLARAGALGAEYAERFADERGSIAADMCRADRGELVSCWGAAPFHPNLLRFLVEMAAGIEPLLELVRWTRDRPPAEVGYVGGNAASVAAAIDREALTGEMLDRASFRGAALGGSSLSQLRARKADMRLTDLMGADIAAADLRDAMLDGATLAGLACPGTLATDASGTLLFGGPTTGGWVYDLRARRFLAVYGSAGASLTCDKAVSADGRWLLHARSGGFRLGEVRPDRSGVEWHRAEDAGDARGAAWHPDGWFLLADETSAWRLEALPDAEPWSFEGLAAPSDATGVLVLPPYRLLGGPGETIVWHEGEAQTVARLPARAAFGERPQSSPDGAQVSIANRDGLHLFQVNSWTHRGTVGHEASGTTHGWSPSGRSIAFCAGRNIQIVASADLSIAATLSAPADSCNVWYLDENTLVIVDRTGSIHLMRAATGEVFFTVAQAPICEGADLRGATGLSDATKVSLKQGGARL